MEQALKSLLLCSAPLYDLAQQSQVAKLDLDPRGLVLISASCDQLKQTAAQQDSSFRIWNY